MGKIDFHVPHTLSLAEAKKQGKLRSEGKTYRVRDGDVVEILFSR